jgi:hypothetical protein
VSTVRLVTAVDVDVIVGGDGDVAVNGRHDLASTPATRSPCTAANGDKGHVHVAVAVHVDDDVNDRDQATPARRAGTKLAGSAWGWSRIRIEELLKVRPEAKLSGCGDQQVVRRCNSEFECTRDICCNRTALDQLREPQIAVRCS